MTWSLATPLFDICVILSNECVLTFTSRYLQSLLLKHFSMSADTAHIRVQNSGINLHKSYFELRLGLADLPLLLILS